jgi:hypothetical protein
MNDKQRAWWERQRSQGMDRFVLRTGVLQYGGIMFIATLLLTYFTTPEKFDLPHVIIRAVTCLIGGVVFGLLLWWMNERGYNK